MQDVVIKTLIILKAAQIFLSIKIRQKLEILCFVLKVKLFYIGSSTWYSIEKSRFLFLGLWSDPVVGNKITGFFFFSFRFTRVFIWHFRTCIIYNWQCSHRLDCSKNKIAETRNEAMNNLMLNYYENYFYREIHPPEFRHKMI